MNGKIWLEVFFVAGLELSVNLTIIKVLGFRFSPGSALGVLFAVLCAHGLELPTGTELPPFSLFGYWISPKTGCHPELPTVP